MKPSVNIISRQQLLSDRPRTMEDAFVQLNKQGIDLQAIKSVVMSMQETIHRLESEKANYKASQSTLRPHELACFDERLK